MSKRLDLLPPVLVELRNFGILRDIDLYLTEALVRRFSPAAPSAVPPPILLATCLANRVLGENHVCLYLPMLSAAWLAGLATTGGLAPATLPTDLEAWLQELRAGVLLATPSPLIGAPADNKPFVLYQDRLYLRRYWNYEASVARALIDRAGSAEAAVPPASDRDLSPENLQLNAQQMQAVAVARHSRLTVISGGPGTGKTHTAARILYLLARAGQDGPPPVIRMTAPTGKAADRLNDSVHQALQSLQATPAPSAKGTPADELLLIPEPACTLERLLGYQAGSPYFRHHRDNPLPADIVLIDEASMIDLPRMAKLLDALPATCRLILLGDMHQLASVAPGSVLGDICEASALRPCVIALTESRRFAPGGIVDTISKAILAAHTAADAQQTWQHLLAQSARTDNQTSFRLDTSPAAWLPADGQADPALAADIIRGYQAFTQAATPETAFAALADFRVLCAMRHGPHGIRSLNAQIENILAGTAINPERLPDDLRHWTRITPSTEFYNHRVIMVTRNDYSMQLFNGDVGIILPAPEEYGRQVAWFPPRRGSSTYRRVSCRLLPEHETAFAITVHKAQGSEFENILVLLPDRPSPVVTKELIYTALTRTRSGIKLWCEPATFQQAILARTERASGLHLQLDHPTTNEHPMKA